jgi:alpha-ketoglutarate-dependent taurine dioxygenase
MFKSRIARFSRLCRSSAPRSLQLRLFSLSRPIWEGQKSFLRSKLLGFEGDIGGEKWFPNLVSSHPSSFIPNVEGEELAREPQAEKGEKPVEDSQRPEGEDSVGEPQREKGPVWRALKTQEPRLIEDVSILFTEDGSATIDPVFLRDSCQCSLCVDGSTLQRKFVTAHIPQDIEAVFNGHSSHGRVKVKWKNDIPGFPTDHQSVYSKPYLRTLTSPSPGSAVARKRHYWDRATLRGRLNVTSYRDFVHDTEAYKTAMSALHRDGLIFIKEVDAYEQAVGRMARRLGPLRSTFYGPTWDVRSVSDSKNVAYTNQHLGFHMDLLYVRNPPGYQLLHCLQNSCSGGESRFADSFFAATRLRRKNGRLYNLLRRYPVEWIYQNDGHSYVQRRPTLEEVSHFVGNEENARRRRARRANGDTDADLAYVNWSPPFQGMLHHNPEFPERTRDFVEAAKEFDQILNSDDMVVELKMGEGTCAIFENRRVVHARNAFTLEEGEKRWLRGAYVDEDAFWSRCHEIGADQYDT